MMDESAPTHFHERFGIPLKDEEVKRRFINRLSYILIDDYQYDLEAAGVSTDRFLQDLKYVVGDRMVLNTRAYIDNDFYRCLRVVEAMYQVAGNADIKQAWSAAILKVIGDSESDLGIDWQPPIFVRTGARLLDERLVKEPLRWLSDPKYRTVLEPFQRGLSHYLEDRLSDAITDMYESVEALARIVTGKDRDLSKVQQLFIKSIGVSDHYKRLLKDYVEYGSEFRHAVRLGKPRPPLSEPEVESFIYLTGLFIRLAIRTT